jgi:hypothetical protein
MHFSMGKLNHTVHFVYSQFHILNILRLSCITKKSDKHPFEWPCDIPGEKCEALSSIPGETLSVTNAD